ESQQRARADDRRSAGHCLEQAICHAYGQGPRALWEKMRSDLERDAEIGREAARRLLDSHDASGQIEADEARADIERGEIAHPPVGADRDLRWAPADV